MILFFPLDIEYTFTALTALIAESNPKDKDKMIGIILLLLYTK